MNHKHSIMTALLCGILASFSAGAQAQTNYDADTNYKWLHPFQFKPRMTAMSVAYLPVGSLEWHGEHLPLGTDAMRAEAVCQRAAKAGGGIVVPASYWGMGSMTGWDPAYGFTDGNGSYAMRTTTFTNMIIQVLGNLDRLGFKATVLVAANHPAAQTNALATIVSQFHGLYGMKVLLVTDRELAPSIGDDHGAKWETSIMQFLHGSLVEMNRLPVSGSLYGVGGEDPRTTASATLGGQVVTQMVTELSARAYSLIYPTAPSTYAAYNDLGWAAGQIATRITTNAAFALTSGPLVDYATGSALPGQLSVTGTSVGYGPGGSNAIAGSDADVAFNGKLDAVGVMNWTAGTVDLTFSNLATNKRYAVILYGNRGLATYTNWTQVTLTGAPAFFNRSSAGAVVSTAGAVGDTTRIVTGNNNAGQVFWYDGIDAGSDGSFTIQASGAGTASAYLNTLVLMTSTNTGVSTNSPVVTNPVPVITNYVACNDLGWAAGQIATRITTNAAFALTSGPLIDYGTGSTLPVQLSVTDAGVGYGPGGSNAIAGSDADVVFNGKLDSVGVMNWTAGTVDLTFSNLATNKRYAVILYGNRGDSGYTNRWTQLKLTGVSTFFNRSSAGATVSTTDAAGDTTRIVTGNNNAGLVFWYDGIDAGPDGTFTLQASGTGTLGTYLNALALMTSTNTGVSTNTPVTTNTATGTVMWRQASITGVMNANTCRLYLYCSNSVGPVYIDELTMVAGSTAGAGANLIVNAGFESGTNGWERVGDYANSAVVTTPCLTGAAALMLRPAVASALGGSANSVWQNVAEMISGQVYTVSCWYRSTNAVDLVVRYSSQPALSLIAPVPASGTAVADADHNGIDDDWEVRNFGASGQVPSGDPDGDGLNNRQEYILGGNPHAPTLWPEIGIDRGATGGLAFTFPSAMQRSYWIDCKTSLVSGVWVPLTNAFGNGTTVSFTNANPSGVSRYYRLRVALP